MESLTFFLLRPESPCDSLKPMAVLRELRRRAGQIAPQVILACTVGYFVYHGLHGERGLLAWLQLSQELDRTQSVAASLTDQRKSWEKRVEALRAEHVDPDLLDERARELLNLGRPDELVIMRKENN